MSDLPKLHIAVLMGGWANERPVSLMSGEGVAKALEERGHTVTRIDMDRKVAARIAEVAHEMIAQLDLTQAEARVLRVLAARQGQIVTRDDLSMHLYGMPWTYGDRRFDVHVTNTDEGFADLLADDADIVMALREIRPEELTRAELAPPMPFSRDMPLLRVPVSEKSAMWNAYGPGCLIESETRLFDLARDPGQAAALDDPALEARLAGQMADLMRGLDAPEEAFARLDLLPEAVPA